MTGRIIRVRPKYIKSDYFDELDKDVTLNYNEFFFNQGRSALKHLLLCYSKFLNKKISIAIQSFNCRVVADAAIESNCIIYLLDNKLTDFSISLNSLQTIEKKIDVLLLTHYQGIPNFQYKEIAAFCKKSNILLIEDLSLTEGSLINDKEVGSLGDFAIKSFAFDKPYSAMEGGSLIINNHVNKSLRKLIIEAFHKIPHQSKFKSNNDLKFLKFLLKYTKPNFYHQSINYWNTLKFVSYFFNIKKIYRISFTPICNRYLEEFIKKTTKKKHIQIQRLRKEKINLLKLQRTNNKTLNLNVDRLNSMAANLGLWPVMNKNAEIIWNRYSILDDNNNLKQIFNKNNIEVGNYNWAVPLHLLFKNHHQIKIEDNLKNSEYCSKKILNIPIWKEYNINIDIICQ